MQIPSLYTGVWCVYSVPAKLLFRPLSVCLSPFFVSSYHSPVYLRIIYLYFIVLFLVERSSNEREKEIGVLSLFDHQPINQPTNPPLPGAQNQRFDAILATLSYSSFSHRTSYIQFILPPFVNERESGLRAGRNKTQRRKGE